MADPDRDGRLCPDLPGYHQFLAPADLDAEGDGGIVEGQAFPSLAAPICSALAYSEPIAEVIAGEVQRGEVHSVFSAAANLLFPNDFVLSLNARDGVALPNGLRLSASRGAFPF